MLSPKDSFTAKLTYPSALRDEDLDYVDFGWMKYAPNNATTSQLGTLANSPVLGSIRLYMPESTPPMSIGNKWNDTGSTFVGPFGKMKLEVAAGGAGGLGNAAKQIPPAISTQMGDKFVARMTGLQSASQRAALNRGKVYNPNIEMLYDSPQLREFQFNFNFTPRNAQEAAEVRMIIREFKKWSSPSTAKEESMFEIPYIWQVRYKRESMMGKFQPAACINVTHQANANSAYHSTFDDGMPTQYSMGLAFKEVDIITREDIEATPLDSVAF